MKKLSGYHSSVKSTKVKRKANSETDSKDTNSIGEDDSLNSISSNEEMS